MLNWNATVNDGYPVPSDDSEVGLICEGKHSSSINVDVTLSWESEDKHSMRICPTPVL